MEKIIEYLNIDECSINYETIGRSGDQVLSVVYNNEVCFLKISSNPQTNNIKVLNFLNNKKIKTPRLIKHGKIEESYYFLMSACKGEMSHKIAPETAVKILAKGLKEIHALSYDNFDLLRDFNYYQNISLKKDIKLIDTINFDEDLAFAHGDYSLPNVLIEGNDFSFIDLDNASITNKYFDIVDCIWSINYNFKEQKYIELFKQEYGLLESDQPKIDFVKNIRDMIL